MYLPFHNDSIITSIFIEDKKHFHTEGSIIQNGNRIPIKTRDKVIELRKLHLPNYISQWLRDQIDSGYVELSPRQLTDLIRILNSNSRH